MLVKGFIYSQDFIFFLFMFLRLTLGLTFYSRFHLKKMCVDDMENSSSRCFFFLET